ASPTAKDAMQDPDNIIGDPDFKAGATKPTYSTFPTAGNTNWAGNANNTTVTLKPLLAANRYDDIDRTAPVKPAKQRGFFVVGPKNPNFQDDDKDNPKFPTTLVADEFRWKYKAQDYDMANPKPHPMLVLQRLTDPNRDEDKNPTTQDANGNTIP